MLSKRETGNKGEDIAIKYLIENGYSIIERNFQIKGGELDIITKKDSKYIFFEIKYRKQLKFGTGEESLTKNKKNKILYSINYYCLKNKINTDNIQFDFISIFETPEKLNIKHYKNINLY